VVSGSNFSLPMGMEDRNINSFERGWSDTLPSAKEEKKEFYEKYLGTTIENVWDNWL